MNSYNMYMIETLSNMHAGSGDTHFGIVDNLIQRNPVTEIPIVHASGLKGALREYFDVQIKNKETTLTEQELSELFGEPVENKPEPQDNLKNGPGHLIFFEASLLTIPLRSNQNVFYYCTSEDVLLDYVNSVKDFTNNEIDFDDFKKWLRTMTFSAHDFYYFDECLDLEIEDYTKGKKYEPETPPDIKTFLLDKCKIDISHLAVFNSTIFSRICKDSIPVIARNYIKEDGISGNLFYEEVLPRKTKLYFILGYDSYLNQKGKEELKKKFEDEFHKENNIYQFGANYSIGYGFSKIEKVY
jgi:CRISPR-associated protein Cmr4